MSYPDVTDQFKKDNEALIQAANQYKKDEAEYQANLDTYKEETLKKLRAVKDPMLLLMMLIYGGVFGSDDSSKGGNIINLGDEQVGLSGDKLAVSGALTQLQNDIEGASDDRSGGTDALQKNAYAMDTLLDETKSGGVLDGVLDPTVLSSFRGQIAKVRGDIYIQGDTSSYNPAKDGDYHFSDDGDSSKIASYEELYKDSSKTGDDSKGARDAMKTMTDAFQVGTSTTQGANSALNLEMKDETNDNKNETSFYNELLHSYASVVKSIVSNTRS